MVVAQQSAEEAPKPKLRSWATKYQANQAQSPHLYQRKALTTSASSPPGEAEVSAAAAPSVSVEKGTESPKQQLRGWAAKYKQVQAQSPTFYRKNYSQEKTSGSISSTIQQESAVSSTPGPSEEARKPALNPWAQKYQAQKAARLEAASKMEKKSVSVSGDQDTILENNGAGPADQKDDKGTKARSWTKRESQPTLATSKWQKSPKCAASAPSLRKTDSAHEADTVVPGSHASLGETAESAEARCHDTEASIGDTVVNTAIEDGQHERQSVTRERAVEGVSSDESDTSDEASKSFDEEESSFENSIDSSYDVSRESLSQDSDSENDEDSDEYNSSADFQTNDKISNQEDDQDLSSSEEEEEEEGYQSSSSDDNSQTEEKDEVEDLGRAGRKRQMTHDRASPFQLDAPLHFSFNTESSADREKNDGEFSPVSSPRRLPHASITVPQTSKPFDFSASSGFSFGGTSSSSTFSFGSRMGGNGENGESTESTTGFTRFIEAGTETEEVTALPPNSGVDSDDGKDSSIAGFSVDTAKIDTKQRPLFGSSSPAGGICFGTGKKGTEESEKEEEKPIVGPSSSPVGSSFGSVKTELEMAPEPVQYEQQGKLLFGSSSSVAKASLFASPSTSSKGFSFGTGKSEEEEGGERGKSALFGSSSPSTGGLSFNDTVTGTKERVEEEKPQLGSFSSSGRDFSADTANTKTGEVEKEEKPLFGTTPSAGRVDAKTGKEECEVQESQVPKKGDTTEARLLGSSNSKGTEEGDMEEKSGTGGGRESGNAQFGSSSSSGAVSFNTGNAGMEQREEEEAPLFGTITSSNGGFSFGNMGSEGQAKALFGSSGGFSFNHTKQGENEEESPLGTASSSSGGFSFGHMGKEERTPNQEALFDSRAGFFFGKKGTKGDMEWKQERKEREEKQTSLFVPTSSSSEVIGTEPETEEGDMGVKAKTDEEKKGMSSRSSRTFSFGDAKTKATEGDVEERLNKEVGEQRENPLLGSSAMSNEGFSFSERSTGTEAGEKKENPLFGSSGEGFSFSKMSAGTEAGEKKENPLFGSSSGGFSFSKMSTGTEAGEKKENPLFGSSSGGFSFSKTSAGTEAGEKKENPLFGSSSGGFSFSEEECRIRSRRKEREPAVWVVQCRLLLL